jgi:hypothetical protein
MIFAAGRSTSKTRPRGDHLASKTDCPSWGSGRRIEALQANIDVHADAWLLDPGGTDTGVASRYCPYEPSGDCSVSLTIVIDREMTIRHLGATHESDATAALELLLELASE